MRSEPPLVTQARKDPAVKQQLTDLMFKREKMSPTGQKIVPRCIMIHRTESGATGDEVRVAEAEHSCGYHYFVDHAGKIAQLYLDNDLIWHALTWSRHAIGIAVFGDFDPLENSINSAPTAHQIDSLVQLCTDLWRKYGTLPIVGHTELPHATAFPHKRCPGPNLDVRALELQVLQAYCLPVASTIV